MNKLTLNEIQKDSLDVLKKTEKIFEELGVKYFLTFGSLIGAIRHKGFIPWDDDVDIFMPRPDYEKFIAYCKENAEKILPLELKHFATNKNYVYPIARISNSDYILEYGTDRDYGLGLFVDVYPLDGYNPEDVKTQDEILKLRQKLSYYVPKRFVKRERSIKNVLRFIRFVFARIRSPKKILKKMDDLAKKNAYEDFDIVTCSSWENSFFIKKSEFNEIIDTPFEDTTAKIPTGYDAFLKRNYGDYMSPPPEEDRIAHHFYNAYKK